MILIALGANLPSHAGSPQATLKAALAELARGGVNIAEVSSLYRSPAWPDPGDPPYANAIARVETLMPPGELMALLHQTETAFGRRRSARNAPRTLDLDLIDYDGLVMEGPPTLPHPRIEARNFVLIPLKDVAPGWMHPATRKTVGQMIAALPEPERTLPLW